MDKASEGRNSMQRVTNLTMLCRGQPGLARLTNSMRAAPERLCQDCGN